MKDLLNKIFTLKGLIFLAVLAVVLSAILIFAPVEATLFGGIVLFVVMAAIMLWAVKKYNSTPKP
jgi:predicted membrane metal-binding protein